MARKPTAKKGTGKVNPDGTKSTSVTPNNDLKPRAADQSQLSGQPHNKDPYMDGSGWVMPSMDPGDVFRDIGSSGLRQFGGWVREEFLSQLVGRQASRVYREMWDNSATIGAILFAIMGTMRKVEWRIEPSSDNGAAAEAADFVESLMDDMSHSWDDFITEGLSMLPFGYAPHEIVYKKRLGMDAPFYTDKFGNEQQLPKSRYDDGKIGWRRLPLRGQETILKWFFDVNGQIKGLTQQPWVGHLLDLPIEKLLLFRPIQHKNNPEGKSILRQAYINYFFIKRLQEQEAVLIERMSGFPVMSIPARIIESAATGNPDALNTFNQYKHMVTNIRIDEQMGMVIPSDTWVGASGQPSAARMFEFKLETPQGGKLNLDTNTPIARHKVDMMTSVLCDFLVLGHEARGTQSLAVTKVDLFMQSVEGYLNSMASVLDRHGLPRLFSLNAMDHDLMPQFVPDLAQRVDLDVLSNFVLRLSQAGMPLFPDADLESYLRDGAGLPDITDEQAARAAQINMATAGNLQGVVPEAQPKPGASSMPGGKPGQPTSQLGKPGAPPKPIQPVPQDLSNILPLRKYSDEPESNLRRMIKASLARRVKHIGGSAR